jgi:putative SOS response-associated peptidase YedK
MQSLKLRQGPLTILRRDAACDANALPSRFVDARRIPPLAFRHGVLAMLRWGPIPSWAKDANIGNRLINARADTVAAKPSFRSAFKRRRCLVPADGFYEWKRDGKVKQPFFIHRKDEEPFAFAGLWERWENPEDGKEVQSCSLITTEANELMAPIHDRMPVILAESAYDRWLDLDEPVSDLQSLLKPFPANELAAYPISTYVNSPKNQGPKCIEPV